MFISLNLFELGCRWLNHFDLWLGRVRFCPINSRLDRLLSSLGSTDRLPADSGSTRFGFLSSRLSTDSVSARFGFRSGLLSTEFSFARFGFLSGRLSVESSFAWFGFRLTESSSFRAGFDLSISVWVGFLFLVFTGLDRFNLLLSRINFFPDRSHLIGFWLG